MNALTKIEPLALPNLTKGGMPTLPVWLARSKDAVRTELQPKADGTGFEDVLTVPAHLLPSPEQRRTMEDHISLLRSFLLQTPASSPDAETELATAVSQLLMVLPSQKQSELGETVRAEAYLDVLDDVPWWSVRAAIRSWYRHDCGTDERGHAYDYRWVPDPGTLRRAAYRHVWALEQRIRDIQKVLDARAYVDCSKELEDGRAAWCGLQKVFGSIPADFSFADAVKMGKQGESNGSHEQAPRDGAGAEIRTNPGEAA